jgi:hypothetical protein
VSLIKSIHDALAGIRDVRGDWTVAGVVQDEEDPREEVDAYLDQEEIADTLLRKEKQIATARVMEEEGEGVVRFGVLGDDFEENPGH